MAHLEEEEVVGSLRQDESFVDTAFPPDESSLFKDETSQPDYAAANKLEGKGGEEEEGGGAAGASSSSGISSARWVRASEPRRTDDGTGWMGEPQLFAHELDPGASVVGEGSLNDRWFLGALSAVASHPAGLVEHLLVSTDHWKTHGVMTCRFYQDGEWANVVVDTLVPVGESSVPMYGHCANGQEHWVQLLEKAYAKLHGSYEALHGGEVVDALVDLTGGSAVELKLQDDHIQKMIADGSLWGRFKRYFDWYYLLTCAKMADSLDEDEESQGILQGHLYSIVAIKEVGAIKFVKVRNPWGGKSAWTGEWSYSSSKWDEHQEVEQAMAADPDIGFSRSPSDNEGTFWMIFEDFVRHFDTVQVLRLFGEDFNQYMIKGEWKGKTAGGTHRVLVAPPASSTSRAAQIGESKESVPASGGGKAGSVAEDGSTPDGDPRWFNNPQYHITVTEPTECFISLLQRDKRFVGTSANVPINAVLLRQHAADKSRVWDLDPAKLVANIADSKLTRRPWPLPGTDAPREVGLASVMLDPRWSYVLVPHTGNWGIDHEFTCRIFSRSELVVTALPETHCKMFEGEWSYSKSSDKTGGPLRLPLPPSSGPGAQLKPAEANQAGDELGADDAPGGAAGQVGFNEAAGANGATTSAQSAMRRANPKWCQNPQYLLRLPAGRRGKTTLKIILKRTDTRGWDKKKKCRQGKLNEVGLVVCKLNQPPLNGARRRKAKAGNGMGSPGTSHHSAEDVGKDNGRGMDDIVRKLEVTNDEWRQVSDYSSTEEATTLVERISVSWADPGLILTPTFNSVGLEGQYSVQVFSDHPIMMEEIEEARQQTIAGEWKEGANGGSHLHPEWKRNPRFSLRLFGSRGDPPGRVKITLSRPESAWRRQCTKDSVGSMMGFYLLPGTAIDREDTEFAVVHEGKPWVESPFVPMHTVSTPNEFYMETLPDDEAYSIIPCNLDPGKKGPFFLSVSGDVDFLLKKERGGKNERRK